MLNILVTLFLIFIILIGLYVWYMSSQNGELKKFGIDGPKYYPLVGTMRRGPLLQQIINYYQEYKERKLYATYVGRTSTINVTDLDMVRDILTRHFNNFADRRKSPKMGKCLDCMITVLTGEQWKNVRTTLSPTFSSGKIKRMTKLIMKTSQLLVENLTEKMESNEPVEMKEVISAYTMDVIANTAFGINLNSVKDPKNPFIEAAKKIMGSIGKFAAMFFFAPFLFPVLTFFGFSIMDGPSVDFISNFVEKAMEERRAEGEDKKKNDFLQLVVDAERENRAEQDRNVEGEAKSEGEKNFHGLTNLEIQAAALIFVLGGYDTTSTVMSFAFFLLAIHPEHLKKVQEELDEKLGSEEPNYDNVANLTYLEMCLNEALRLYPPGFILERTCLQDTEIQGFTFPKGYGVRVPVIGIHRDPAIWEDPEDFRPKRFSQEQKESRHPYAFLPFGYGPRNCIGMRLALVMMKVAIAGILQKITPVPCDKTVYPIQLENFRMVAKDGLWLKMEKRN